MNSLDFFATVLADSGIYCAVGLKPGRAPNQVFFDSYEEIIAWGEAQAATGTNAYFGVATYKSRLNRSKKNTDMFKSMWVDLDIGKGTQYDTQAEGVEALREFCQSTGMPKPTIVSSGLGLHVYWSFSEAVGYNVWKPLVVALTGRILTEKFAVKDLAPITQDAARILRIPNTLNFKLGEDRAKKVKILFIGDSVGAEVYEELLKPESILDPLIEAELSSTKSTLNDTTKALLGNIIYKFSRVMQKSLSGSGCAQMAHIYLNQNDVDYNLWRAGLSIAAFCVDKESAIHKLSSANDDYCPAETDIKASDIKGPYLCSTFNSINPELCVGCKHIGTYVSTPLLLGKDILEATPMDNLITAESAELGTIDIEIPPYPFPYSRGPNGGVYAKGALEEGEEGTPDKILVYENDFYVVGRRTDPNDGEVLHLRLIRPHDGVSDFVVPLATISAGDRCRDFLSYRGVAAHGNQMKLIMTYLVTWTKHLQNTTKAELVRVQFGWTPDNASFIIGSRELSKGEPPKYSPPSSTTQQAVGHYTKAGSLSAWTNVANTYSAQGNEVRAFALFLSLGAPMFKIFALGGAILHLTNASSGVGKSTIQYVANSVWGHPTRTMLINDDKILAKYQRMGIIQNLILCIDELTNLPAEDISDLAFGISNGRGRNRMSASSNVERVNNTSWAMPCITSGNNSLHEVLQTLKANPEGETLRILELEVTRADNLTKQQTDQLFSRDLISNYGHAGDIMMQYVLDNYDACVKELFEIQEEFDKSAGLVQPDRYYSALVATAIFGGRIANALGLVDIPVEPVVNYIRSKVGHTIKPRTAQEDVSSANLGLFMSENMQNQLVILNRAPAIAGAFNVPIETPRGALVIRRETDTNRAYIIAAVMKTWCAKKQISYKCMTDDLRKQGILLDITKIRMSAGTVQDSPAVVALVLDSSFLN